MMRAQWTIGFALLAAMAVFLAAGFFLSAMFLLPAPVAYFWLKGKNAAALGMLAGAMVMPALITGSVVVGVIFGAVAAHGLLLGALARNRISLGVAMAAMTLSLFAFMALYSALNWDMVTADWRTALQRQAEKFESADDELESRQTEAITEWLGWIDENLVYLYFGAMFSGVMLMVAAVCSMLYWWLPPADVFTLANYRFSNMRTPEHLVWLAIVLAGLWFWDNRWPNETVRFVSWNGALALATVYWLNGLSVMLYISHVWKWRPLFTYLILLGMLLFNVISVLSIFGFFDTWIDFRRKAFQMRTAKPPDDEDDFGN